MSGKITITIGPDGNTTIDVKGVKGSSCKDLTREIERALGRTVSDSNKPEFFQQNVQQQRAGL